MSLIEKAVERLGQLKQAGQDAPVITPAAPPVEAVPDAVSGVERSRVEIHAPEAEPVSRAVNIDLERLAHMGFVTPNQERTAISEEYRVIKRPLLRNASSMRGTSRVANGNLIMVTSALPGEGKSFTALNLAMSIAMELDHSVLLVDADVSKPSILKQMGLPPERGLMDVLVDGTLDLPDVILRTNIEKLRILPAGTATQRATELLASEGMNRLLDEMASRYADRIIVFDSPPLLVTTESRVLATHMGQIVVVVEAERTTHAALKQALATIEACPIKMMLLNKSTVQGPGGYYGYGYGYGQEQEDDKAA